MSKLYRIVIITCVISFSTLFISFGATAKSNDSMLTNTQMDVIDIMITAYRFLSSEDADNIWNFVTDINEIEPLYDLDGSVIAYYLDFKPAGYIIVNNNIEYPVALEFSMSNCDQLSKKISYNKVSTSSDKVYYGGSLYYFCDDDISMLDTNSKIELSESLSSTYNLLKSSDINEEITHMIYKRKLYQVYEPLIKSSYTLEELLAAYNIIKHADLPAGSYTYDYLYNIGLVTWGTTGEFDGVNGAYNHCAATAAFNVIAYYKYYLNRDSLFIGTSRTNTFGAVYDEIGPGPVTFIGYNNGLNAYVSSRGSTYHYSIGGSFTSIKNGIDQNKMSTILLSASLFNWHMVNGVGYRNYTTGAKYIRIINGWENSVQRYILYPNNFIGSYLTWIS